jgi:16S rRNA (guanine966-N2)-methyltransferase
MRIIAGKYFRKSITVEGRSRPPLRIMRQYIFDFLSLNFPPEDKIVLDLCSGSGSFGLECLSRGAKFAYFFEEDPKIAQNLKKTISDFGAENAKVVIKNVKYLPESQQKVDLIFFDPPFGHNYSQEVIDKIVKKSWPSEKCLLVFRTDQEFTNKNPSYSLLSSKRMGISFIYIYEILC